MCIEEALRSSIDRLATVQLLSDLVAVHRDDMLPSGAFSGMADICEDVGELLRAMKERLPVETLAIELRTMRKK